MAKKKKDPLVAAARQVVKDTANKAVKQTAKPNVKKQQPKQSSRQNVRQSAKDVSNIARNTMRNAGESSRKATVSTAKALPKKKAKPFKASDLSGNTGRGVTKQARKQTKSAYTGASQRKAQAKQKEKDIKAGKFNVPNRLGQADEMMLSKEGKNQVNYWKDQWEKAKARGDKAGMQKAHEEAEKVRLTNPATVKTTTYEGPTQSQVTMAALQQYAQAMQAGDAEGMQQAKNLAAYAMLNVPKDNREQSYMTGAYSGGTWGDRALEASESDVLKNQGKNILKSEGAALASAVPEAAGGYIETVMNAPDMNGGSSQLVVKDQNVDKRKASQFDLRGQSRYTEEDARAKADHYQAQAEYLKQIAYATTPLPGVVGKFAVDATAAAGGMGIDLAANTIVPGAGLVSMGARTFGSSVQQAKDYQKVNGTDGDPYADAKAYLYGAAIAGTEIASEKMFGGPFQKFYGRGLFDAAAKGARPTIGKTILKGMLEEGSEELAADLAQWQAPRIYGGETETLPEMLKGAAYDFTLGAALGGLGGAVTAPGQVRAEKVRNLRKRMESAGYAKDDIDAAFQRMTVGDMEDLTDSPDSTLEAWVDTVIGRTNKTSQNENQSLTGAYGEQSSEQTFEEAQTTVSRGKAWDALRSRLRESGVRDAQMLRTIRDRMSAEEMEEAANLRKNDFLEWRDRVTSPDYQPELREEAEPTENITAEELNVEEEDELSTISTAQINKLGDNLRELGVDSRAVARAISDDAVLEQLVNMDAEELRTWAEEQKAPAKPSNEEVSEMLREQEEMLAERREREPEPSTEGLSGDAAMVREMAEYLGDAGRSTMIGHYDPKKIKDASRYVLETRLAYNAGFTGNQISRTMNRVISPETANRMYEAGVMDKQAVNEQRRRKQARAKFYNSSEAGLGRDANGHYLDEYVENLARQSKENAMLLDEIDRTSKAFGTKVLFPDAIAVRNKEGKATETAGGGYTQANIMLDKDLGKALEYTYGHELTHRMAEIDPKAYELFKKYVMSRPDSEKMYTELQYEYNEREIEADHDLLVEETCAEFSGAMISQADMLRDFARMADQNVVQRFFQALRDMARKLTGREKAYVERAVKVLDDAYRERYGVSMNKEMKAKATADVKAVGEMYESSLKQARKMSKTQPKSGNVEDVKYSIKRTKRQEKRDNGEKLTESQFYGLYSAHIIAGGRQADDPVTERTVEGIKENGFQGDGGPFGANVLPTSSSSTVKGYTVEELKAQGKGESTIKDLKENPGAYGATWIGDRLYYNLNDTMRRYGARKGQAVLLVPESDVDKNDKIRTGFKPFDYEIVTVERDFQPYYELYSKAYDKYQEQNVKYSLRGSREFNDTVVLEESTVDTYLQDYAAPSSPNYAQAYIVHMSPRQFLDLTTSITGRAAVEREATDLDLDQLANATRFQPFQLRINHETGEVYGHEGRHRMEALRRNNVYAVPVLLFDSSNKSSKEFMDSLTLTGQDFGSTRSLAMTTVHGVLPLSYANRDEIIKRFATQPTDERIAENYGKETVRYSIRSRDSEYLQAVRDGDMEKAQRMVDDAAKEAGFDSPKLYHSTDNKFTVFDRNMLGEVTDSNASDFVLAATAHVGFWFNTGDIRGKSLQSNLIPSYIKMESPLYLNSVEELASEILDSQSKSYTELEDEYYEDDSIPKKIAGEFVAYLERNGYDGIVLEDEEFGGTSYVALRPEQIKSSDPVTYDDNGEVIPLSERFNPGKSDIRYSIKNQRDSLYMKAVEDGDMLTAQMLVDEASEAAGYTVEVYHGTRRFGFTEIDIGKSDDKISFFVTEDPATASTYSGTEERVIDQAFAEYYADDENGKRNIPGTYRLYMKPGNFLEVDARGNMWNNLSYRGLKTTREIAKYAFDNGYDGVHFLNVIDHAKYADVDPEPSDVYALFHPERQLKSADPITIANDGSVVPLSERFNPDKPDIRWALRGGRTVEELAEAYGIIPPGEKRAREVRVPQRTDDDNRVSRAIRTIMEAQTTPEQLLPRIEEMIANGEFSYSPITNKESVAKARATINELGYDEAWRKWSNDIDDRKASSDVVTLGWILYDDALKDGNVDKALEICAKMARFGSQLGQAVQALSILKRLPTELQMRMIPQPRPKHVQDKIDEYENDEEDWEEEDDVFAPDEYDEETGLPKPKPKKPRKPREKKKPTQEEVDQMEIDTAEEQAKRAKSTFMEKWNAWRYLAMLFNLRTHDRNIVGNLGFAPIVMSKNLTATVAEIALYNTVGKSHGMRRTKSFYGLNLFHYAWNDFLEMRPVIMGDAKYEGQERDDEKVIFRGILAPVEKARKLNSALLDMEDAWFSRPQYANALAQFMAANGITVEMMETGVGRIEKGPHKGEEFNGGILQEARAYAVKEAQKATYRDLNDVSQFFMRIGKPRSDNNKVERFGHMLIEGIIPFRKTPANILCRAMEYSPAGFAKGMYDLVFGVPRGKKTVAEALDMLCSGFSGTGIFVLGMYLAKMGLLVAKTDDGDDEQKYFSQLLGHQQWALEINGYSITIDWLAPEVVPLFMGAQYFTSQTSGNPIRNISNMLDSASMVIDPVLELSCLSGVQETLDNAAKFAEGDLNTMTGLIATMGLSYMSQGIPTLFGQLERVSQEERMRTFTTDDPERALSADWQYQIGKISAKIPGWDYHQIPYVDSWGNTETETNLWKRIVSNMVSPAYFKKIDDRAVNKELQRLYDATGDGRVLPDPGWKTYTYKDENGKNQTYFLTEEEYLAYGRAKGRNNFDLVQKFIKSPAYQKVSDADKAEIIDDLYYYGEYKASSEYIHNYRKEPYSWVDNYNNFSNQVGGYDVADFIIVRNATQDVKGLKDPKHPDKNAISGTSACSKVLAIYNSGASVPTDPEKHEAFMEALDVAKTYRGYNKAQAEEFLNKTRKKYGITD